MYIRMCVICNVQFIQYICTITWPPSEEAEEEKGKKHVRKRLPSTRLGRVGEKDICTMVLVCIVLIYVDTEGDRDLLLLCLAGGGAVNDNIS